MDYDTTPLTHGKRKYFNKITLQVSRTDANSFSSSQIDQTTNYDTSTIDYPTKSCIESKNPVSVNFDANNGPNLKLDLYHGVLKSYDKVKLKQPGQSVLESKAIRYQTMRNHLFPNIVSQVQPSSLHQKVYDADKSAHIGWQRVGDKYHANTDIYMSSIKHNLAFLKPTIVDIHTTTLTWLLHMGENFYYDNILLLLGQFCDKCKFGSEKHQKLVSNTLRNNYSIISLETAKFWIHAWKIGEGSFGIVYRVTDSRTNDLYAVKYIKPNNVKKFEKQTGQQMDFLKERNTLIKVHKSPFAMQFLCSFKLPEVDGLFLLFEYCVSDLTFFFKKLYKHRFAGRGSIFGRIFKQKKFLQIKETQDIINEKIEYDINEIIIVYAFELFCGLDFLAKCEIVHRDIKPANIMISQKMHLKIGDFGLVMNNNYLTSPTNSTLIHNLDLSVNSEPYENCQPGTDLYMDPDSILYNEAQDFMSDAYAVALIILKMMLFGNEFFLDLNENLDSDKSSETEDYHEFIYRITKCDFLYNDIVKNRIVTLMPDEPMKQLAKVIAPLFKPRSKRITPYLATKQSQRYGVEFKSAYVDIESVKTVEPFSTMKLTPNNVLGYSFPLTQFLGIDINKKTDPTFYDIIKLKLIPKEKQKDRRKRIYIQPGINVIMPQ